jgi:hypothetical protein
MNVAKKRPLWFRVTMFIVMTTGATALVVLGSMYYFGSLATSLSYLAGDRLLVDSPSKYVGVVEAGEVQLLTFRFYNMNNSPIILLGSSASCSCTVADSLPITVPPHSYKEFLVKINAPSAGGPILSQLRIFTNAPRQPIVLLQISGQSLKSSRMI